MNAREDRIFNFAAGGGLLSASVVFAIFGNEWPVFVGVVAIALYLMTSAVYRQLRASS